MKNLFVFLWRQYFFFLFLTLEIISFTLIFKHNNYQQASFLNTTYEVTGSIYKTYRNISDYFYLKQVNKQLAEENARLHAKTLKSYIVENTKAVKVNDTVYKQQYQYICAKVISSTVNKGNNYLMLNQGYADGIHKDMGIITSDGVVGVVSEVSKNFCYVISILSKKLKISAKIKKDNQYGSITWNGINYRVGNMEDVPSHAKIKIGDTIITSGNSYIFPEGILVGTISDFKVNEGESFYSIKLKFMVDYNKINYVYVVDNLLKDEQKELEKSAKDE